MAYLFNKGVFTLEIKKDERKLNFPGQTIIRCYMVNIPLDQFYFIGCQKGYC